MKTIFKDGRWMGVNEFIDLYIPDNQLAPELVSMQELERLSGELMENE